MAYDYAAQDFHRTVSVLIRKGHLMDRSNPDYNDIWQDRYGKACLDFQQGGSEDVLRASLYSLGYTGARLSAEVSYQRTLLPTLKHKRSDHVGFVSGLPD